jgi:hypothetical protein
VFYGNRLGKTLLYLFLRSVPLGMSSSVKIGMGSFLNSPSRYPGSLMVAPNCRRVTGRLNTMPERAELSELRPLEREESEDAPSRVKGAGLVGVASPADGCLEKLTASGTFFSTAWSTHHHYH